MIVGDQKAHEIRQLWHPGSPTSVLFNITASFSSHGYVLNGVCDRYDKISNEKCNNFSQQKEQWFLYM